MIGAAGYLGQFVVEKLLRETTVAVHTATCTSEDAAWAAGGRAVAACHRVDVTSDASVSRLLEAAAPAVVINCSAMAALAACEADPGRAMSVNCPLALLRGLQAHSSAVRLVHVRWAVTMQACRAVLMLIVVVVVVVVAARISCTTVLHHHTLKDPLQLH